MYDDILIATDGSETVWGAVANALSLADAYDATVHVLYVVDVRAISTGEENYDEQPLLDILEARGERATAEVQRRAESRGVQTVSVVEPGTPANGIRRYAEKQDVDLVAMGTRGRSGLRRHLLGSVAGRVLRNSTRPVLTTRASTAPLDTSYDEILLPVDGSDQAARAADHAFDIADRYGATVYALSVIDTSLIRSRDMLAWLEAESEAAVESAKRRGERAGIDVKSSVWKGNPDRSITEYAEKRDVDLIATGAHAKRGLDRFLHRGVVERVVRTADCPVLTVPKSGET